jgi:putative nucleotidyltransferase with HDIG domain
MGEPYTIRQIAARFREDIERDLSGSDFECPTFVDAAMSVRLALKKQDMSNGELARVISTEPLLSARVVALANSAAFRRGGPLATDVRSAVTRVGQNAVHNVAIALTLQQVARAVDLQPFRGKCEEVWAHSIEVAVLAYLLARQMKTMNPDEALFAGLVHDMGHFYLMWRAAHFPELTVDSETLSALLRDWHAATGAAMLRKLGLSEAVTNAVLHHARDVSTLQSGELAWLLGTANRCAHIPVTAADMTDSGEEELNERWARATIATQLDEVIWMLAAMKL